MIGLRTVFGAIALLAAPVMLARAEGLDFADQNGMPVEVYADKGLELSQDAKTVIARGNAKAIRGRVTVTADTLIAYYRDKQPAPGATAVSTKPTPKPDAAKDKNGDDTGGNSEVWRLEAQGHVVIFTDTQRAYGDHADYNIDDAVVVLTGKNLRLTTPADLVTARDSLEYWEHRQQAVARGDAVATRANKRIRADVLVADYAEDLEKKTVLRHATGFDNVVLTTPTEIVTGNRADYDPQAALVTVTGAVKMTRGQNQLDGGYAVVNLDTGISRVFPNAPGTAATTGGDDRVKGLLVPERRQGSESGTSKKTNEPASLDKPPPPPPAPGASQ